MKKILPYLLSAVMTASAVFPVSAADNIAVTVDGKNISFDVSPQIINDRTMVPMRAIFDALGADVYWDDSTKTVTAKKENTVIKTTIGNNNITINDVVKTIDTAPVIVDDRTLVPVRFVSESLGAEVDWNAPSKTVIITTDIPLEVHFIDVGQADASLIINGKYAMLVDGGNKEDGTLVYNYLKAQNIDYLDYIICTHGHEDHVGGLPYVLERVNAGTVIVDDNYDTKIFNSFLDTAKKKNVPIKNSSDINSLKLGNSEIQILAPIFDAYSDYNDNSIVFRLDHENNSFLFTGDAGYKSESDIIASGAMLDIDVLKVGHHGSSTASSPEFLDLTTPEYAVISCGENNSYGHPHTETINSLYSRDIVSYRTDEKGNIIATSDGDTIRFTFEKNSSQAQSISKPNTQEINISYIGNKNTKKLHLPTCSSLPAEKNRAYFNSISDALSQGYTSCKNCAPS